MLCICIYVYIYMRLILYMHDYVWIILNMYMWTWVSSEFWYSTNQETAEREESLRWKLGWGYLISLSSIWEARIIHAADIDVLVLGSSRTAPTHQHHAQAPFYHQWQCIQQLQLQKLPFQNTISLPPCPLGIQQISPVQLVEFLIQWRCSAPAGFQWTISTKTWCYLMLPKCSCIMLCFGCPSTNNFPTFLFWWQINACWPGFV